MFSKLEQLLRHVDITVTTIAKEYPAEVKCEPGCADCCHAVFDVSFIEAAYIAAYLEKHPEIIAEQQERASKAAEAWEISAEKGVIPRRPASAVRFWLRIIFVVPMVSGQ